MALSFMVMVLVLEKVNVPAVTFDETPIQIAAARIARVIIIEWYFEFLIY
jgi:hypothetical protein